MPVRAGQVAEAVGGTVAGDSDAPIVGICQISSPEPGKLCFARNAAVLDGRDPTETGAILLCASDMDGLIRGTHILVANPRLAFAAAVERFFAPKATPVIATSAVVDPSASIGRGVGIGHHCVIGPNVRIGDDSQISHNVVLAEDVQIGARCHVGSNSVIGEPGFGWAKDEAGRRKRIPHLGTVVIGDDVEIGALSSIASGTIGLTRIGNGVKIDDHVFIAHNVTLEENVAIVACAEISGSVTIGRNTWIGPNVSIRDGLTVAADSLIGMGSVVVKDIVEPGVYAGIPARYVKALDKSMLQG
jgi:UDP-3-O-[3-hydroxymyristoyl] glucosamine N-acyltransferase